MNSKKRSVAQEIQVADSMRAIYGDAHVQPGSGNQPGKPNDVRVPGEAYIECKETASKQFIFPYAWIQRLRTLSLPLRGYLALKFSTYDGSNYYVVEDEVFEHLLKCELELRAIIPS